MQNRGDIVIVLPNGYPLAQPPTNHDTGKGIHLWQELKPYKRLTHIRIHRSLRTQKEYKNVHTTFDILLMTLQA